MMVSGTSIWEVGAVLFVVKNTREKMEKRFAPLTIRSISFRAACGNKDSENNLGSFYYTMIDEAGFRKELEESELTKLGADVSKIKALLAYSEILKNDYEKKVEGYQTKIDSLDSAYGKDMEVLEAERIKLEGGDV